MKFLKAIIVAGLMAGIAGASFAPFAAFAAQVSSSSSSAATSTGSGAGTASSSSDTGSGDTCGVTKADVGKIAEIKNDPSFTPSEEVVQELAVRKELVSQTIACAEGEVQALQSALAQAPVDGNSAAKAIQSQLSGRLDDAAHFYNIELGKLDGAGIAGTQAVAAEVLAWREGDYASLAGQISNFLLWLQNQGIFATAGSRMDQTKQAVNYFESVSSNSDLQTAFNSAYASFQTATADNAAAQSALQQSLPASQSLSLIKQSLDALQGTYQQLFAVSSIIQKILPQ